LPYLMQSLYLVLTYVEVIALLYQRGR
jgi:hypothetical protein